jgi:translocation and assembly module TamB
LNQQSKQSQENQENQDIQDIQENPLHPAPPRGPKRSWGRVLRKVILSLALLLPLVLAATIWLLGRESVLQRGLPLVLREVGLAQAVQVRGVHGSLWGPLTLDELVWQQQQQRLALAQVSIDWQPWQLLRGRLQFDRLHIGKLSYAAPASNSVPALPLQLGLPVELRLDSFKIAQLDINSAGPPLQLKQIELALASQAGRWQLQGGRMQSPWGKLQLDATLAQQAPFALLGKANLSAFSVPGTGNPASVDLNLPLQLSGNLRQIHLAGKTALNAANVQAALDLTLFERMPLQALQLQVQHLDPSKWRSGLPMADLNLALDLHRADQWQGQIRLDNAASGGLDQARLPLRRLSARIGGIANAPGLQDLLLDLGAGGQFQGMVAWDLSQSWLPSLNLRTANLNLQGLQKNLHPTRIKGAIDLKPGPGQWQLHADLAQQGLQLVLAGSLQQQRLQLQQARLQAGAGIVQLSGEVSFATPMKLHASGQMLHFDLAKLGNFPASDLNADLALQGQAGATAGALADAAWQLELQGKLRQSHVLQRDVSGRVEGRLEGGQVDARIDRLALDLQFGANSLRAHGALGKPQDQLQWQLAGPDLQTLGWGGSVQAQGALSGDLRAARTSLSLQANGLRRLDVVNRTDSAQPAKLAAAVVLATASQLRAHGELDLWPTLGFQLALEAEHLNPAAWGDFARADIHARAQIHARDVNDGAKRQAGLDLQELSGSLLGQPLSGHAVLELGNEQLRQVDVALAWGKNHLGIKQQGAGKDGLPDALEWQIEAPDGLFASQVPPPSGQPVVVQPDVLRSFRAEGRWQGSMRAHTLGAHIVAGRTQADLQVAGGWQTGLGWAGSLQSLRGSGGLVMQAPMTVQWLHAAQQLNLGPAQWVFDGGKLGLDALTWNPQQWRTRGKAQGLGLTLLANLKPEWQARLAGGLRFTLDWDLVAAEHLNGKVNLVRESGDWQPLADGVAGAQGDASSMAAGATSGWERGLGLQTLTAGLVLQQDQLQLNLTLASRQAAAQLALTTRVAQRAGRWGLPGTSPLQLQASARLDSIAPLAVFANGQISCDGSLAMQVAGSGSIANPLFSGSLNGDQLGLRWINEGLQLKNGALRAQWQGEQLQIDDLHFDGVQAQGKVHMANAALAMHLSLKASELTLFSRPDRLLVISGETDIDLDQQGLQLNGKLKADRAMLELLGQDTPVLSPDIRLLRGNQVLEKQSPSLPVRGRLDLDLGPKFQVRGQGLDARLSGQLRLQALAGPAMRGPTMRGPTQRGPRLVGEVQVAEGSYRAWGQNLRIERGAVNFSGAWDNPGLNVLALRQRRDPETEVEVGVELRGTLLAPQVRLVSTPPLPDSEKLAWLVLGHGQDSVSGKELDLLGAASSAFLGSSRDKVANTLGLDEIGMSYGKGVESAVLSLGKRLSARAYLSFEQGIGSASGLVKLRYSLNPRLSVQLQTGSNNAVDVFYGWRFD